MTDKKKTVLMVTVGYYPSNGSGVHRSVATAKYLPFFGFNPVVVCRKYLPNCTCGTYDPQLARIPDTCKVVRIYPFDFRVINKVETKFWNLTGGGSKDYRFPYILYQKMKTAAEAIVKNQKIDVIWSTYLPGLDHKIADYLSRKYNIPWVADFRDLPDQSEDTQYSRFAVKQEVQTCRTASALIATTDEMAQKLRTRHSVPVYTILNGFDPQDYETQVTPNDYGDKFTINHFGILYEFRNPSCLFAAIDRLLKADKIDVNDIEVNFYGAHAKKINQWAKPYQCASCIHVPDRLPYPQMLKRQKASQVLLLVTAPEQAGAIPAKLYGYLASRRPVLCVPGDGAGSDRIIAQTKAGLSASDPNRIAEWLYKAYQDFKQNRLAVFDGDEAEIQKFSRKTQTGQLADTLISILANRLC